MYRSVVIIGKRYDHCLLNKCSKDGYHDARRILADDTRILTVYKSQLSVSIGKRKMISLSGKYVLRWRKRNTVTYVVAGKDIEPYPSGCGFFYGHDSRWTHRGVIGNLEVILERLSLRRVLCKRRTLVSK